MYFIRFAVPSDERRPERRTAAGIFHATYRLAYEGRFEAGERAWFRGDASRIWRIVTLVEREGVPVAVYRTRRPGVVVYQDDLQIAAVPWRDTFEGMNS